MDKETISKLQTVYNETGLDALVQNLSQIAKENGMSQKNTEKLAKSFFDIIAGGGDSLGEETAVFFENLVLKFPRSAKLAEMLADVYGVIINETQSEMYQHKLDELVRNNPGLENAALQQVYALLDSDDKTDSEKYAKKVNKIKQFYDQYPKHEFALRYLEGLRNLSFKQENEEEAVEIIDIMERFLNTQPKDNFFINSNFIAVYLDALSKLTWLQDEKGCAATIAKMESYWKEINPKSYHTLACNLAYTLSNYCCCVNGAEKEKVINRIAELGEWWQPATRIADEIRTCGVYQYANKPKKAK